MGRTGSRLTSGRSDLDQGFPAQDELSFGHGKRAVENAHHRGVTENVVDVPENIRACHFREHAASRAVQHRCEPAGGHPVGVRPVTAPGHMLQGTMHAVPGSVTERADLVAIVIGGEDPGPESGGVGDQVTGSSDEVTGGGEDSHGLRLPSVTKLTPMTYRLAADAYDYTQIPGSFNARDRIVLGYDH